MRGLNCPRIPPAAAALLAVALAGLVLSRCAHETRSSRLPEGCLVASKGPFTLRIPAKGSLESETITSVSAPNTRVWGLTINALAPEGTEVHKGDLVAEFDPTEVLHDLAQSRSELAQLNKKIEKTLVTQQAARDELVISRKKAELGLAQAEAKLKRMLPELFARNDIIEAELERDLAGSHLKEIEEKLVTVRAAGKAEVEMLRIEEKKIESKIDDAEKSLASMQVKADADGVLIYKWRDLQIGTVAWKGSTFCEIHQKDRIKAKVYVLEQDAGFMKTGQAVEVVIDAFPERTFKGKVEKIDSLAKPLSEFSVFTTGFFTTVSRRQRQAMKYFETEVSLDEQDPERMKPGLPVTVTILAADIPEAVSVPLYAVFEDEGKPFVYVLNGKEPERRPVELGARSRARAVVAKGIAEGDRIALRNPYLSYAEFAGGKKTEQKTEEGGT